MESMNWNRLLTQVGAVLGGLAVAAWAIYHDYLRRHRDPGGRLGGVEPGGSRPPSEEEGPIPREPGNLLATGLILLGVGVGFHHVCRGLEARVAWLGYLPASLGIACLAAHASRRMESGAQEEEKEGSERR